MSDLIGNPKDRFSRDAAQLSLYNINFPHSKHVKLCENEAILCKLISAFIRNNGQSVKLCKVFFLNGNVLGMPAKCFLGKTVKKVYAIFLFTVFS